MKRANGIAIARLTAIGLLALASCSPAVSDAPTQASASATQAARLHAESGLEVIPVVVASGGKVHRFEVEVARSRIEQAKGLMFRRAMGADEGMLFPLEEPRRASFWMRNTVIPLDIIFIGADGRILNVAANAVPYSEDQVRSVGVTSAVLELNGGRAAELGIVAGDKVTWGGSKPLASHAPGR